MEVGREDGGRKEIERRGGGGGSMNIIFGHFCTWYKILLFTIISTTSYYRFLDSTHFVIACGIIDHTSTGTALGHSTRHVGQVFHEYSSWKCSGWQKLRIKSLSHALCCWWCLLLLQPHPLLWICDHFVLNELVNVSIPWGKQNWHFCGYWWRAASFVVVNHTSHNPFVVFEPALHFFLV